MTEFGQAPSAAIETPQEVEIIPETPSEPIESKITKMYGEETNLEDMRL